MARRSTMIKTTKQLKYKIRQHNRCKVCFRGRSYLRKFGLCRICFRNLALGGYVPGVGKASW